MSFKCLDNRDMGLGVSGSIFCTVILIFYSRFFKTLHTVLTNLIFITMLNSNIGDYVWCKNKQVQKSFWITSILSLFYKRFYQHFTHNTCIRNVLSVSIFHLSLAYKVFKLWLQVYWDHMPRLASLSNGLWFIIYPGAYFVCSQSAALRRLW